MVWCWKCGVGDVVLAEIALSGVVARALSSCVVICYFCCSSIFLPSSGKSQRDKSYSFRCDCQYIGVAIIVSCTMSLSSHDY
jgi:hypothetical protein